MPIDRSSLLINLYYFFMKNESLYILYVSVKNMYYIDSCKCITHLNQKEYFPSKRCQKVLRVSESVKS